MKAHEMAAPKGKRSGHVFTLWRVLLYESISNYNSMINRKRASFDV